MLPNKSNAFLEELQNFFTSDEKASSIIFNILGRMRLPVKALPGLNDPLVHYSRSELVCLLVLFPLLHLRNVGKYVESPVARLFKSGKDTFYRLKNNPFVDWRTMVYSISTGLISKALKRADPSPGLTRCLILDDTDLTKTGYKIEMIGRIWSHVHMRSVLGFKGLFLGYHDGKSFFGLDFSLHGELGKNKKQPFGLKPEVLKERYSKERSPASPSKLRLMEYFSSKTDMAIELVSRAIRKGIRFDYLLVDSWFVNERLIRFIKSRKSGGQLLGMIKMGKTRYECEGRTLTAPELVNHMRLSKKIRRSRSLHVSYASQVVNFKGVSVKLFFCRSTSKGKWNALLSTDAGLKFEEAYRIYSTRWTIEVFFKESKQNLNLGKCQARDFDAQIADISLVLIQYNILSLVKRFEDYETMGELFRECQKETLIITLADRLWQTLIEILMLLDESFDIEMEEILNKLIDNHPLFNALLKTHELDLVA